MWAVPKNSRYINRVRQQVWLGHANVARTVAPVAEGM